MSSVTDLSAFLIAGRPYDAWSTISTRKNYQGVMSPLLLPISDRAVNGAFHDLGVLRRDEIVVVQTPGEATSAVFYGPYIARINYFHRISDLVPGQSGAGMQRPGWTRRQPGRHVDRLRARSLRSPAVNR